MIVFGNKYLLINPSNNVINQLRVNIGAAENAGRHFPICSNGFWNKGEFSFLADTDGRPLKTF